MEKLDFKIYVFLFFIILTLISGIKGIIVNKSKSDYIMSINLLGGGIIAVIAVVLYFSFNLEIILLIGLCISFIGEGMHGLFYRKKINNSLFTRFNLYSLYGGLILLIPIFLYFIGYFR